MGTLGVDVIPGAPKLAPFNPSSAQVIEKAAGLAGLEELGGDAAASQVVYDLGCGDGRLLVHMAEKYGCKCVGVEYDQMLVDRAVDNVRRRGLAGLVEIRRDDATKVPDIENATIVFMYLTLQKDEALQALIRKAYENGATIISNMFSLKYLGDPVRSEVCDGVTRLYCYEKVGEGNEETPATQGKLPTLQQQQGEEEETSEFIKWLRDALDPLKNPNVMRVFNAAIVALFLLVFPLMYRGGIPIIHVASMAFLSFGLFVSVNWFVTELRKVTEEEEQKKKNE